MEVSIERLALDTDRALRAAGLPERAVQEKRYLKSALRHYGASVPAIRKVAKGVRAGHPDLTHDELIELVDRLWSERVHERRLCAVELLDLYADFLQPGDLELIERLLRESKTWALVDGLAANVVGGLVERHPGLAGALDRWIEDDDFWIRRSALLAELVPLRRGEGDFERFARHADVLLDETEFFIRKAIGWVLRDTSRSRPELVFAWLEPRAARCSGVTVREAIKYLSDSQRAWILAEYERSGGRKRTRRESEAR